MSWSLGASASFRYSHRVERGQGVFSEGTHNFIYFYELLSVFDKNPLKDFLHLDSTDSTSSWLPDEGKKQLENVSHSISFKTKDFHGLCQV